MSDQIEARAIARAWIAGAVYATWDRLERGDDHRGSYEGVGGAGPVAVVECQVTLGDLVFEFVIETLWAGMRRGWRRLRPKPVPLAKDAEKR
jgi:hypothetical protein